METFSSFSHDFIDDVMSNEERELRTKLESSFAVITLERSPAVVTEALGIAPSRWRHKGEAVNSGFSPTPVVAQYGLWEVSMVTVGEDVSLSEHIVILPRPLDGSAKT